IAATACAGSLSVPTIFTRLPALSIRESRRKASGSSSTRNTRISLCLGNVDCHVGMTVAGGAGNFGVLSVDRHQSRLQVFQPMARGNPADIKAGPSVADCKQNSFTVAASDNVNLTPGAHPRN